MAEVFGAILSLDFEQLAQSRREIQEFCLMHGASVMHFSEGPSFRLHTAEPPDSSGKLRHLTTTATCISSLRECPARFDSGALAGLKDRAEEFGRLAIDRDQNRWLSEESAGIYCRCRALPLVLDFLPLHDDLPTILEQHVAAILYQRKQDPTRVGIGEAAEGVKQEDWYPPNAFHTYWALRVFSHPKLPETIKIAEGLDTVCSQMLAWSRQSLGFQVSLHSGDSSVLDTDQLAWALSIVCTYSSNIESDLAEQDFIKQAIKCLFDTQTPVGTWRHYRPLFHYKKAGNAYCYIFETLATLLNVALDDRTGTHFLRESLKPYAEKLIRLWEYALTTQIRLTGHRIGWCSGHRTNIPFAESWATASVFSYAHALRRLLGIWTRDSALKKLNVMAPTQSREKAEETLKQRSRTWLVGSGSEALTDILYTMFINPVLQTGEKATLEPDSQPIADQQPRSAILFGPPGASKTSIVRALARTLNWDYVEIHASDFVASGLPEVQKTADELFAHLMELDHTVVLFDEIDELVREREEKGTDAFGRFLTTSMLPKLAELWEQRKILYFVATNHIKYFDDAVTRSQRFDALILVAPPSLEVKKQELTAILDTLYSRHVEFNVTGRSVLDNLKKVASRDPRKKSTIDVPIAALIALRHDELTEFATHIKNSAPLDDLIKADEKLLKRALSKMADKRFKQLRTYIELANDSMYPRRDQSKFRVWKIDRPEGFQQWNQLLREPGWLQYVGDDPKSVAPEGYDFRETAPGQLKLTQKSDV